MRSSRADPRWPPEVIKAANGERDLEDISLRQPFAPYAQKGPTGISPPFLWQFAAITSQPDFVIVWLMPWAVFAFLVLLFENGFMNFPSACILLTALAASGSIFLLLIMHKGHVWLPLGTGCLLASLLGAVVGLYVYDQYACFPMFYANSRIYTNVVPSQPSGAVADAGKITFSSETAVDTNHSVGFMSEKGSTFCVAPVRDKSGSTLIQFWAVGVDCCGSVGDFICDDAADANADAGIRVFDNNGFFYDSRKDFYIKARRKAEATYGLVSAEAPMYIHWVRQGSLDMLAQQYASKAASSTFCFLVVYLMGSGLFAYTTYRPRRSDAGARNMAMPEK
mmetsp:Transcript_112985/g.326452  ORF Transcript_112985/g.326452 Transcript_112985/m.326452 type:complete len:337 (+) Transcript_112985:82-1092(+)